MASRNCRENAFTNLGRQMGKYLRGPSVIVMFAFMASAITMFGGSEATAQVSSESKLVIPERLRYLFDLPWCKKWRFSCVVCVKRGDRIGCERIRESCHEPFRHFFCREFDVPENCQVWSDGCNTCSRHSGEVYCTAMGCPRYDPKFTCLSQSVR